MKKSTFYALKAIYEIHRFRIDADIVPISPIRRLYPVARALWKYGHTQGLEDLGDFDTVWENSYFSKEDVAKMITETIELSKWMISFDFKNIRNMQQSNKKRKFVSI